MSQDTAATAAYMAASGYWVYPVTVRLDEKGKKRPEFPGSWKDSVLDHFFPADFEDYDGFVVDCEKSGIVVIDLDWSDSKSGVASLKAAGVELPHTPMRVRTQSGGFHGYYRQPEKPVGTYQGVPVQGVDIRGLGGCVFGPDTVVYSPEGEPVGLYSAVETIIPVSGLPVLSEAFVAAIDSVTVEVERGPSTLVPYAGTLSTYQDELLTKWYNEDLDAIVNAGDGERHRVLLSKVGKILDRGMKLDTQSLEGIIHDIQQAYEDSGGDEWDDKKQIVEWSLSKVAADPMGVPAERVHASELEREAKIREEQSKIEIRREAKRRADVGSEPVDTGRVLSFDEPEGSLYHQAWVEGVLPKGETVILFGQRYHGKSVFGLDLGLSVAGGVDWHGRNVEQGNVLYLAGEGTIGLPARRRAWVAHHGEGNPFRLQLRDRVVQLGNPGSVKAFQSLILEQEIDLLIVDTLRRAARGLDIADPGVAQDMIEVVDDLRRVRHGCTALVLHHPTKTNPTEPAGGGTLQDAVSVIHFLEKDEYNEMTLTTTKMKDGPDGEIGRFYLTEVAGSIALTKEAPQAEYSGPDGDPFQRRRHEEND